MKEDKAFITKKLEETINETRMGQIRLEYFRGYKVLEPFTLEVVGYYDEAVEIRAVGFDGEEYLAGVVNVSCDSGIALIRDVLRHEFFN
jgi:hypothetical protein